MRSKNVIMCFIDSKIDECYKESKKNLSNKMNYFTAIHYLLELKKELNEYL